MPRSQRVNCSGAIYHLISRIRQTRSRARCGAPFVTAACVMGLLAAGCSWTDAHGTHHLIVGLGFGVITSTNRNGVEVRDSRILGAEFGPEAIGVGYLSRHRVVIDPTIASNVVVSVKANPFALTVEHHELDSTNAFKTRTNRKEQP